MNDIEQKALALLNEAQDDWYQSYTEANVCELFTALCRAIEQHEAFRQEVSDAVADAKFMIETHCDEEASTLLNNRLSRFIIPKPKPDPLVEAMHDCGVDRFESWADQLRAALDARGFEIREKGNE